MKNYFQGPTSEREASNQGNKCRSLFNNWLRNFRPPSELTKCHQWPLSQPTWKKNAIFSLLGMREFRHPTNSGNAIPSSSSPSSPSSSSSSSSLGYFSPALLLRSSLKGEEREGGWHKEKENKTKSVSTKFSRKEENIFPMHNSNCYISCCDIYSMLGPQSYSDDSRTSLGFRCKCFREFTFRAFLSHIYYLSQSHKSNFKKEETYPTRIRK